MSRLLGLLSVALVLSVACGGEGWSRARAGR